MTRTGKVVEKKGGIAVIAFDRLATCEKCNGCFGGASTQIELEIDADIGDAVDIEMPDGRILSASAIAYLIPLALLLIGLLGGSALHGPLSLPLDVNLFSGIAGLLLLALGLVILRVIDRTLSSKHPWQPRVLRVHKNQA